MAPPHVCHLALSPASTFAWLSPHKHFPLWSPSSGPLRPSPNSQEQTLPWDYFSISMFQLPAAALSKWLGPLSGVCMATASIVCMIIIPFRLSQISYFTFQQPQMFNLCHKQLPLCRTLTPASVLPPCRCRSSPAHSLFFTFLPVPYRVLVLHKTLHILHILFLWSGTPDGSQLVFCKIFCVCRYIFPCPPTPLPSWILVYGTESYTSLQDKFLCRWMYNFCC